MIVRLIAVDPKAPKGTSDLVVYQVPGGSRAHLLLVETFEAAGIEVVLVESAAKNPACPKLELVVAK